MNIHIDFTTIIANFAKAAALHAENLRKEAARIKAEPDVASFPEYNRLRDQRASQVAAEAQAWQAKAVAAEEGYLLYDQSDVQFTMLNQDLINAASACERVKYAAPLASPVSN